ncbi:MAG: acylphosphatase [Parcubacteria group bacterium]|nr:acylphosphatase [Parcubacteria group bacterium]
MLKEIRCKITGKVQMVMYRDFVQRKARGLNISGTVENREDRSVEVVAQGMEENLQKLIEYLHKGPFLARVARVDVEWREPQENFSGFKIIY